MAPYFADPTGQVDASQAIQAAANALAGTGMGLFIPAGTFLLQASVQLPSGITIVGGPGTRLVAALASVGTFTTSAFYAPTGAGIASTALGADAVLGCNQIQVASASGMALGSILEIDNSSVGATNRAAFYTVAGISGTTITLDRPVVLPFKANDACHVLASIPHDIRIYGNGMSVSGTCLRYFELVGARDCVIAGIHFDAASGAATDAMGSFDIGSYRSYWQNCTSDAGGASQSFVLESCEACGIENCSALNGSGYGIGLWDCVDCYVRNCTASNNAFGCVFTADGDRLGCTACRIEGGNFDGNTTHGVVLTAGTNGCELAGFTSNNNGIHGIWITGDCFSLRLRNFQSNGNKVFGFGHAAGAKGISLAQCEICSNGTHNLDIGEDLTIDGLYMVDSVDNTRVLIGAGAVTIRGMTFSSNPTAPRNSFRVVGGTVDISQSTLSASALCNILAVGGGVAKISHSTVKPLGAQSGEIGLYVSGGTLRIGEAVDADSCATPILVSGGYCSRTVTVVADGSGNPQPVSWPDLKTTDEITLILRGSGSVQPAGAPVVTKSVGTGFSVSFAPNDTSTYEYWIR